MIKKELKPFAFIEKIGHTFRIMGVDTVDWTTPTLGTLNTFIGVNNTTLNFNQFPNEWSVNLGGQTRLRLHENGDLNVTGRVHALGSVMYDTTDTTIKFWDGNQWVPINPTIIH